MKFKQQTKHVILTDGAEIKVQCRSNSLDVNIGWVTPWIYTIFIPVCNVLSLPYMPMNEALFLTFY